MLAEMPNTSTADAAGYDLCASAVEDCTRMRRGNDADACLADVAGRMRRGGDELAADACEEVAHRMRRGGGGIIHMPAYTQHTFHLCWCVSRVIFFIIYLLAVFLIKEARKFSLVYCTGYAISIILTGVVAVLARSGDGISDQAALACTIAAVVVECCTQIAPVFVTNESERPPIDVEHQIERSELWCILILGESILSIVATVVRCDHAMYMFLFLFFFLSIFFFGGGGSFAFCYPLCTDDCEQISGVVPYILS